MSMYHDRMHRERQLLEGPANVPSADVRDHHDVTPDDDDDKTVTTHYRGFRIRHNPPPIPHSRGEWQYEDDRGRCGSSIHLGACMTAIDRILTNVNEELTARL